MVSLGFEKKILGMVLKGIDKKLGKMKIGGVTIDKITDIFQGQDKKIRELELKIEALEHYLKDKNK